MRMSERGSARRARVAEAGATLAFAVVMAVAAGWYGCAGRTAGGEPDAVDDHAREVVDGGDPVSVPAVTDEEADADSGAVAEVPEALTCNELHDEFYAHRMDVAERAPRACRDVADCELVSLGEFCFGGCGFDTAIASAGAEAARLSVTALGERHCAAADAQGCEYQVLPCVPPPAVTIDCVGAVCSVVYED